MTISNADLDALDAAEKAATAAPWNWLGYDIFNGPDGRQWRFVQNNSEETWLVAHASPGDLIPDISRPAGVVMRSISTGYHGETDIDLKDEDKALIALARNSLRPLLDELRLLRTLATAIDNYYLEGELATIEANEALAALRKHREAGDGG